MNVHRVPLAETGFLTPLFQDYLHEKPSVAPFYRHPPTARGFAGALDAKAAHFGADDRARLLAAWRPQYEGFELPPATRENLEALADPRTFTVTTGHQLNLFSGPLYFIYKLVTVVNLARRLREAYPHHRFVPVYWMASEDHDFAEINHFHLFGQTYAWQTDQRGAVGRFRTEGFDGIFAALPEAAPLFERAYR
ncbi:MAG: bacillithiol biosynthesis BshC, partial [Catalinimonas sp.]